MNKSFTKCVNNHINMGAHFRWPLFETREKGRRIENERVLGNNETRQREFQKIEKYRRRDLAWNVDSTLNTVIS
jgi:hypothetical protein